MLPLKDGTGAVWPRTGVLTKHHDIGALPYRGGSGRLGIGPACVRQASDPHRPPVMAFSSLT